MNRLRSKRAGVIALTAVGLGATAAAAFAVDQAVGRSQVLAVEPASGAAVASTRPMITAQVEGLDQARDLVVELDGRKVTGRVRSEDDRLVLDPGTLTEGRHEVEVRYATSNLFARSVAERWSFEVDTTPPELAVSRPAVGSVHPRRRVPLAGSAEPGSEVQVSWPGGSASAAAGEGGAWRTAGRLPEGPVRLEVTARDAAGNATRSTRTAVTDTTPPTLEIVAPPKVLRDDDDLTVSGAVPGEDAQRLTYAAGVNGRKVAEAEGVQAVAVDDLGEYTYASFEEPAPLTLDGRRFSLDYGRLPQGRNRVVVVVRDVAGNATRRTVSVMVDTSEAFGDNEMVRGAKGEDVRTLQRRLKRLHLYRGRATAIFDRKTERAVTAYQRRRKIAQSGRIDAATLRRMIGRVVINLEQRKLRLIQDGRVVETYRVAVGQPAYPTPTGRYEVVDKQVDPSWFPPDSPWAAGLGSIPPGPGNPLGTRWIGTSAPAIGIHGTYARGSIGTAASHGCIRMHIEDVEELYDQVSLGSSVEFR